MADIQASSSAGSVLQHIDELVDDIHTPIETSQHPDDPLKISCRVSPSTRNTVMSNTSTTPWLGDTGGWTLFPIGLYIMFGYGMIVATILTVALILLVDYIYTTDGRNVAPEYTLVGLMGFLHWIVSLWPFMEPPHGHFEFPRLKTWRKHIALWICASLTFGIITSGYWFLVLNTNTASFRRGEFGDPAVKTPKLTKLQIGRVLQAWSTGHMPNTPQGCQARVLPHQSSLFTSETYNTQFARTYFSRVPQNRVRPEDVWEIHPKFDLDLFRTIHNNNTLCEQGIIGNQDINGLGFRCGIYLQWLSSLLANNFLSTARHDIQAVYLFFSTAICLVTVNSTFFETCTFSIEIQILYWIYWGGFWTVFGTAPCSVRLGAVGKWVQLDWTSTILFATHWIMSYHGMWFIWRGYDQHFARMPCGTYHFFGAPVLDPSVTYWALRDWLTMQVVWVFPIILAGFPLVGLILIPEAKHAVQRSAIYQFLFSGEDEELDDSMDPEAATESPSFSRRIYGFAKTIHGVFRKLCLLPSERRGGIRLVTPVDIKHRRSLRIRWGISGLSACILSIIAIELTLKWNKVQGVYTIKPPGQYIQLLIGALSFASVCKSLVQQEAERRRQLRHRRIADVENGEEIEMQGLGDAISHAFSRPDDEFFAMSGALPVLEDDEGGDVAMSGALPVLDDDAVEGAENTGIAL